MGRILCNGDDVRRIKVHQSLVDVCENLRRGIAEDMKKKYKLSQVTVPMTLSSQVLASEKMGLTPKFKIRKTGLNTGILELEWH